MLEKLRGLSPFGARKSDHPLADARELRRVVDGLRADSSFKALDDIIGWLESLRDAREFPEDRLYEAVCRLDDAAQPHLKRVTRDYLHAPRQSAAEEKRLWTICHDYWVLVAGRYECCLEAASATNRIGEHLRQAMPALGARMIVALGNTLKWTLFRHGPADGSLWQRLGAALLAAENAGVAGRAVAREGVSGLGSPQQEYVRILALHAASVDSLAALDIELVERLIANFSAGFVFSAAAEADSVYWVDLAQPVPPTRLARMPPFAMPTQRFFKPAAAHAGIAKLLHDLERGNDIPANIVLGGHYHAQALLPALRHLAAYLAPVPPQRRHDRHAVKQHAMVVHGFGQVVQVLSGRYPEPGAVPVELWQVENVSRGGFGAHLDSLPGEWLKVGALLALQPNGGGNWLLGIVRRFLRRGDSGALVGIETLALQATPVDLRVRATSSYAAAAGIPALLIREACPAGEVRVLMPFASFSIRDTLECELDGQRLQLSPIAVVERMPDYELARFRLGG